MRIQYLLNGVPVNPRNRNGIYLEINHDQQHVVNQPRPHVGINNLAFAREDVARIMEALNQAPGITEGIPFDIKITEGGVTETINMYLDLMDGLDVSREGVQVKVKMLQSLDWLDDKVDSFTFESLYNETGVRPFTVDGINYTSYQDFIDRRTIYVPYVVSSVPNWHDAFLATFGMVYVANELYKIIKQLIQWATPLVGIGAVVGVAQLVLEIVYAALLLALLIELITQLINCLIQPIKYHGAMLIRDMMKLTGVKLGLNVQSSIWDTAPFNQLAYIPEKYNPIEGNASSFNLLGSVFGANKSKGYTSPGYAPTSAHDSNTPNIQHGWMNGTGGDLLRLAKTLINGKIIIPDQTNVLQMERRDYYPNLTSYQLPPVRQDWNGYNTDELIANTMIKFATDMNERNCIDHKDTSGNPFYPGTILQATHQQIATTDARLVGLKGVREIQIPVCRGVAKDSLTFIEKAVKDVEVVWGFIYNSFGGPAEALINGYIHYLNFLVTNIINPLIAVWNALMDVIGAIINIILDIIGAITSLFGGSFSATFNPQYIQPPSVPHVNDVTFPTLHNTIDNRFNTLLLENDMMNVPKVVMVDTSRSEYASSRIAYLHSSNASVVNGLYLWNNFYFIDAFTDVNYHNRFTKISPALNNPSEKNRVSISLQDFKNLVSNPRFRDSWGEDVIADSVQWYIEQNGAADFMYRKKGWLSNPQSVDAAKRSQEIALNLQLKVITPNGQ